MADMSEAFPAVEALKTVSTPGITAFVRTLRGAVCHPAGLPLEVTPEDVRECLEDIPRPRPACSSPARPCDPRLNPAQAMEIVDHFASEVTG
jgi:3-deoxy-7-phosphoheptulonate synthase